MCVLKSNELHRIFEILDRDGDGYVSVGELDWLLDKVDVGTGPDELESIMGKKSLDLHEFMLFYNSISQQCRDEGGSKEGVDEERDLIEAFKVFDLNGDGFISCEELRSVLSRLGLWEEKSGSDCRSMIYEFDTNSDGLLDFDEFKNMMLRTNH
ncbi:hypothetical protein HHK36_030456 [Tetracentron sinense]|uniref:EF-hand domain-containing protein n=1 Tax=Tetracentron sinense TaxID=13715 RepID=A0A835D1K4_TETSI|nr:hypothetical protein HHK36_030456 [Tetracentron sinense]